MTLITPPETVDLLVLGAGWTSTFLLPLLTARKISYAATTRAGSPTTIAFTFDPASDDPAPFRALPVAGTVLITFPITGTGHSQRLVDLYTATHPAPDSSSGSSGSGGGIGSGGSSSSSTRFIQLGSTSVWSSAGTSTRHTPLDTANARGQAEAELLALGGTVLNLAGLWDGSTRDPKRWLGRVADTKEKLRAKDRLHLVHGEDVARVVVAVHQHAHAHGTVGQRWLVTDLRSYDWWDLALAWGQPQLQAWVVELMAEAVPPVGVFPRALGGGDGRVLDSNEFWQTFGLVPARCLL